MDNSQYKENPDKKQQNQPAKIPSGMPTKMDAGMPNMTTGVPTVTTDNYSTASSVRTPLLEGLPPELEGRLGINPVAEQALKVEGDETPVLSKSKPFNKGVNKHNDGWFGKSEYAKAQYDSIIKKSNEAGKYCAPIYEVIMKNKSLKPIDRLVCTIITKYGKNSSNDERGKFYCDLSRKQIMEKIGVNTEATISKSIKRLEDNYIFTVDRSAFDSSNKYYFNYDHKEGKVYSYYFVTGLFLESSKEIFTAAQKSFICAVIPHVLGNDECRYSNKELENKTGISKRTINERKKELKELGYLSQRENGKGFIIDLSKIMSVTTQVEKICSGSSIDGIPQCL